MNRKSLFRKVEESNAEINISPLLDMVFILLIFFVVTTTFTRETGVTVKKPKASSATQIKDKIVKIAITREGTVHVFEKQVDMLSLGNILKREKLRNPEIKVALLADTDSNTGALVQVVDQCNLAGIPDVSIAALNQ